VVCVNTPLVLKGRRELAESLLPGPARPGLIQKASPAAVLGLLGYMHAARSWLLEVTVPVLVVQALQDRMTDPSSARLIHDLLGGDRKELWYCPGTHLALLQAGREGIFRRVVQFIDGLDGPSVVAGPNL